MAPETTETTDTSRSPQMDPTMYSPAQLLPQLSCMLPDGALHKRQQSMRLARRITARLLL